MRKNYIVSYMAILVLHSPVPDHFKRHFEWRKEIHIHYYCCLDHCVKFRQMLQLWLEVAERAALGGIRKKLQLRVEMAKSCNYNFV